MVFVILFIIFGVFQLSRAQILVFEKTVIRRVHLAFHYSFALSQFLGLLEEEVRSFSVWIVFAFPLEPSMVRDTLCNSFSPYVVLDFRPILAKLTYSPQVPLVLFLCPSFALFFYHL